VSALILIRGACDDSGWYLYLSAFMRARNGKTKAPPAAGQDSNTKWNVCGFGSRTSTSIGMRFSSGGQRPEGSGHDVARFGQGSVTCAFERRMACTNATSAKGPDASCYRMRWPVSIQMQTENGHGSGPFRPRHDTLIRKHGLSAAITFTRPRSKKR